MRNDIPLFVEQSQRRFYGREVSHAIESRNRSRQPEEYPGQRTGHRRQMRFWSRRAVTLNGGLQGPPAGAFFKAK